MRVRLLLGCLAALVCAAQPPDVGQNGVVNAASRIPATLRGAAIARGARFLIFGVRFTGTVKVNLRSGGHTVQAAIRSVTPEKIEALMPASAPLGENTLTVQTDGGESRPFPVTVAAAAIGLYSANELGWGQGRIEIGGRANSASNPARPGQPASILTTGTGIATGAIVLVVGGKRAAIAGIDRNIEPGLDRIRFQVPSGAPEGCFVPLYARSPGASRSNIVTMAISARSSHCDTPAGQSLSPAGSQRFGVIGLSRTSMLYADGRPRTTLDEAFGAIVDSAHQGANPSPLLAIPPEGLCTAYAGSYQSGMQGINSFPDALLGMLEGRGLDAGKALAVEGKQAVRPIPRSGAGSYWVRLGLEEPGVRSNHPLFFDDREYAISGTGGADVAAFTRVVPAPAPFDWIDEAAHGIIPLAAGMDVHWRGTADNGLTLLLALSTDSLTTATSMCLCSARPSSGTMAIPPEMLEYFPPTREMPGRPAGLLLIVSMQFRPATPPAIAGMDQLSAITAYARGRRVVYRY